MESKITRPKVWNDERERADGVCNRILIIGIRVKGVGWVAMDLRDDPKPGLVKLHVDSMQLISVHDRTHTLGRAHCTLAGDEDVGHVEHVAVCISAPKDKALVPAAAHR